MSLRSFTVGTRDAHGPSRDELYEILSNRRRRFVISVLKRDDRVELGSLAERLAAWERDKPIEQVTSDERKSAYTSLQQRHLPRMADVGVVEFDRRAGVVERARPISQLDVYAEVVPGTDVPWSHYYLGMSVVLAAVVACGTALSVPLPPPGWGVFCAVTLLVSAAVHTVATRQMRLGERPPEE